MRNYIEGVFLFLFTVLCSFGCRSPEVINFVTEPPSSDIRPKPIETSVAILSWKDERDYIRRSSTGLAFIPLFPSGERIMQSRIKDSADLYSLKPMGRFRCRGYSWGYYEEYTIPIVLEDYLKRTNTFSDVHFLMSSDHRNIQNFDFIIRGTIFKWSRQDTTTFYGLSVAGVPIMSLFYLPWRFSKYEIDFLYEFIDNRTGKILYSQRCMPQIPEIWKSFPFLFGLINYPAGNFTSEDLKPFISAFFKDFVNGIQHDSTIAEYVQKYNRPGRKPVCIKPIEQSNVKSNNSENIIKLDTEGKNVSKNQKANTKTDRANSDLPDFLK